MTKHRWGFDTRTVDANVRPQDDFYKHAHGKWLKKTKIPSTEARWGPFSILRVETEKQLKVLVEGLKKGRYVAGSPEQMIRDFYASGLDEKHREKLGTRPLLPYLARIEAVRTKDDLEKLIAAFHRLGIGVLWGGMVDQDSKASERYALHFYQDGLGMPEREYYLKDTPEAKRVKDAYIRHVEKMHRLLGLSEKEAKAARETILRIETALARVSMNKEDARDSEKTYHKFPLTKLKKHAHGFDWPRYLRAVGVERISYAILMQPEFVAASVKMLDTVSISDWKTYMRWHLLIDAAGALSRAFVREQFNFYAKTLAGTKKMKPLWRRALGATNACLGELLGQLYVRKYFTQDAKVRMSRLVDDLFEAYEKRIKALDWMTPATKKKALVKLRQMSRKIGYPDKWKSYRGLVVKPDDYFGNLMRSAEYEHRRMVRKLGRPIDRTEWYMYPQTVNAYFSPNMNDIAFPAAILQPPFFDPKATDDAVNYGSIGSVIGHEITHGFDDQGSKFDGKGNMKSWWTKVDRKRFEAKAKIVKEQFDKYEVADGVKVNGQLTLGENIADLGGASIAYDAFQTALARSGKRELLDGYTPEQRFFYGFSLFERELTRPEFEKTHALTDPHAPSMFRINGPLSNLDEFYTAFEVTKGHRLYRDPKSRAKIW
jgi:putative endopeptidase